MQITATISGRYLQATSTKSLNIGMTKNYWMEKQEEESEKKFAKKLRLTYDEQSCITKDGEFVVIPFRLYVCPE